MRTLTAIAAVITTLILLPSPDSMAAPQQRLRERLIQRMEQRAGQNDEAGRAERATPPPGAQVERDIAYGPDRKQRYDVYLPARVTPGAPILVMVHGGGWRTGDKALARVVNNKATWWLARGGVFVSVNNRLVPDADPLEQARDVAAAVASIQQHARQWQANPAKTLLMGHSAGAHLVALLGSNPALLRQAGAQPPLGVVALDSGALDVPALMTQQRVPSLYRDAFGSDPAFWASVSPQQQLQRDGLPMLLVCSSTRRIPTPPCDEARKLAEHGRTLGVPMQVLPQALTHAEINDQLGLPSAYTDAVAGWIDQRLR
ncbi:MAG: alpha/beta hydrolase [Thermomonas hydrothermalis]|uniref:alpha/beta hydrolase n=1 Tax=Thermomonas hydrothermalis TaxID=213588 RepID=UPI002354ED09|nr:alpha/beta hydrolase [Thermomonas hydrothermalis]MCL6618881.1 alpha/beta hydrolase [Thermomonas hydrothermalis]